MTTKTATLPTISLPVIPPSSSVAKSPFAFSLSNMFHCGCDPANVEEGVPMIYQQASYDSACAAAVDDEAFYYNHVVKHNNQTYQEQRRPTTDYFQHLPINSEMQSALIIPTSPITSQHQRAQQQEPQLPALPSNKSLEVTPVNSIEVTPVSSNRTLVTVTPDKVAAPRFHPPNRIKHTVSNVTESTHSMSDDEMSIDESNSQHEDEEEENSKPTVRKPASILRQKPEENSRRIIQSPSRTHTETRVQFAANTNLANPAQRQHVPRLSLEARYAYAYQAGWLTSTQERSFLQALRNPKASPLKICTTRTTTNPEVDVREGTCIASSSPHHADEGGPDQKRFQQRLERRKGQNQYLYRTHNTIGAAFESSPSPYMCKYGAPHPTKTVSSSSLYTTKKQHPTYSSSSYTAAEELLLSQLNYNDNSGFYVFR